MYSTIPYRYSILSSEVFDWSCLCAQLLIFLVPFLGFASSSSIINLAAVRWYGEAEFWLSWGKLLLMGIVFAFTFVTMVGGNPKHDAYGFRYWNNPVSFPARPQHCGELSSFFR